LCSPVLDPPREEVGKRQLVGADFFFARRGAAALRRLKFALRGLSNWWTGLERAGYPDWVLAYTLSGEFSGVLLITLGIYTRWVSLYTLPVILGATLSFPRSCY